MIRQLGVSAVLCVLVACGSGGSGASGGGSGSKGGGSGSSGGGSSSAQPISCNPATACETKAGSPSPPDRVTYGVHQCSTYNATSQLQSSIDAEKAACKVPTGASSGDSATLVTSCPTANLLGGCKILNDENQCKIVYYYSGTTNPPKSTADVQSSCTSQGGTFLPP
ncbi:MAG: hypothetical protein K1X89_13585 [Myxococcaceae bacterium]|nr:hypothetical protein [Myxococcaceae bacterium]